MAEQDEGAEALSDAFAAFGISDPYAGLTPEDGFYRYLTAEKMPKIYNCEYWLRHELAVYEHLQERLGAYTKASGATRTQVSTQELVRSLLEYYFLMYHHPRFVRTDGRLPCDMNKFLDIVMNDSSIKKYLHKAQKSGS